MTQVISLGITDAIDTIQYHDEVFLKSGVWNDYKPCSTDEAIKKIKNSGYGADVYFNEKNEMYYVSIPCDSDMW